MTQLHHIEREANRVMHIYFGESHLAISYTSCKVAAALYEMAFIMKTEMVSASTAFSRINKRSTGITPFDLCQMGVKWWS